MHEAFLPICLLRDYPYALECLACYDNFLLVGTKQGLLLIYELTPKLLTHPAYFVPPITARATSKKPVRLNLTDFPGVTGSGESDAAAAATAPPAFSNRVHTTRTLGKKPILQLSAIPELDLLLALAEGKMNVYQLQNCQLITTVPNSRGAVVFAHCLSETKDKLDPYHPSCSVIVPSIPTRLSKRGVDDPDDERLNMSAGAPALRICVAVKRRLLLWRWNSVAQEFVPPGGVDDPISASCLPDLNLPEDVRSVMFVDGSSLLVGLRAEYLLVSVVSGEVRSISSPGRNQIPLICRMPGCFRAPEPELHLGQLVNADTCAAASERVSLGTGLGPGTRPAPTPAAATKATRSSIYAGSPNDKPPFGLGRDDVLQVVSGVADMLCLKQIRWTGVPHEFHVYPPYIIGAMDKFLEVRVADSCELVQQLPIARVQAMCHFNGWLYAATGPASSSFSADHGRGSTGSPVPSSAESMTSSSRGKSTIGSGNEVWLILSANRSALVEQMIKHQEFDLARRLAEEAPWMGQTPIETRTIATLHACHLYRQQEFGDALRIFTQQIIDPSHVLGLFPDVIPETVRSKMQYPPGLELLGTEQCASASEPLITYLLTWRRILRQALSMDRGRLLSTTSQRPSANDQSPDVSVKCHPIVESNPCISSSRYLLELIDTGLLKCYLATNSARVAPLLRQANSCQLEESEKTLFAHHRYQDVVMLYQSHGIHRKALSVLQHLGLVRLERLGILAADSADTAAVPSSHSVDLLAPIDPQTVDPNELENLGHPRTIVRYLQTLGPSHFDLVVDYGAWVMRWYPFTWMRIFLAWEHQLFLERREPNGVGQSDAARELKSFSRTYRGQVLKYLEEHALHLVIPFLELLIFGRPDKEVDSDEDDEQEDEDEQEDKSVASVCEANRPEVQSSLWRLPSSQPRRSQQISSPDRVNISDPDSLPRIFRHANEPDPRELHTCYAAALMARVRSIQPPGKAFAYRVCEEQPNSGVVARLRRRLLRFLQHPDAVYSSAKLLAKCPYDALFEERALLLSNLNNHEQALTMWVHVLNDWDQAVSHCVAVYERSTSNAQDTVDTLLSGPKNSSEKAAAAAAVASIPIHSSLSSSIFPRTSRSPARDALDNHGFDRAQDTGTGTADLTRSVEQDIFFLLVLICVQPPEPASLGILLPEPEKPGTDEKIDQSTAPAAFDAKPDRALEVLRRFGDRVDASKVVRILPATRLSDISHYLKNTFLYQESLLTHLVFLRSAAQSEMIASRTDLVRTTGQQFVVMAGARCRTCRRRIGNTAFARYPTTGELEHYGCCRNLTVKR